MRQLIPVAAFFSLAALHATARADVAVVNTEVWPSHITFTLDGAPLRASALTLRESSEPRSAALRATSVRSYADGDEPIAIAFVYNGQEVYVGNDMIVEEDDASRFVGAMTGLQAALDSIAALRFPEGSEVSLVAYADGATVRLPMTRLDRVHGRDLGTQKDYYGRIGTDLVTGIETGLHQLELSHAPIKALIVIGDGNDTNNETAKQELIELKRRAARDKIHTFAITYKGQLSDPGNVINAMIPTAHTVASFDHMATALDHFLTELTDRSYVTFSGENLAWDGHEHALTISAAGEDLDTEIVQLPLHAQTSHWYRSSWWQQLGAGLGAILLIAFGLRFTFRWRNAV